MSHLWAAVPVVTSPSVFPFFFFHFIEAFWALPGHRFADFPPPLSDPKWVSVNELGLWTICFIVHFPLGGLSQSPDLKWMVPKCVLSAATPPRRARLSYINLVIKICLCIVII